MPPSHDMILFFFNFNFVALLLRYNLINPRMTLKLVRS